MGSADGAYNRLGLRIVDMPTVPRQQVVHSVHRSQRNVRGVIRSCRRQNTFRNQGGGQIVRLLNDLKSPQVTERFDTAPCGVRIAPPSPLGPLEAICTPRIVPAAHSTIRVSSAGGWQPSDRD